MQAHVQRLGIDNSRLRKPGREDVAGMCQKNWGMEVGAGTCSDIVH